MKIDFSFLILIFSLIGIGIMSFLIYQHYFEAPICNINTFFSCDTVNKSVYSEVFHIPIAAFGLAYFVIVAILSQIRKKSMYYILILSIVTLVPSVGLTYIELFVLHAVCVFCESSKILIVAILIISYISWKRSKENEKTK
jgi:uncharacterized membrane protein